MLTFGLFPHFLAVFLTKMSDPAVPLLVAATYLVYRRRRRAREEAEKGKRLWVRSWISRRTSLGFYDCLMKELENEDLPGYKSFQRLNPDLFAELLHKVAPLIKKEDTNWRPAVPPEVRLALTLRFLATGEY